MRLLIVGATGLVGEKLFTEARARGAETFGTYLTKKQPGMLMLDITNKQMAKSIVAETSPDCIVQTAALANVDYCEDHRKQAHAVNVQGTQNVAEAAKEAGCKMVYISTDYVFDGGSGPYAEDDPPNPINYYGLTKLEGEKLVKTTEDFLISS